jgi:hypothetical protein
MSLFEQVELRIQDEVVFFGDCSAQYLINAFVYAPE